jgi:PKD repeat protein
MRKLSALLLAWLFICLAGSKLSAQTSSPDVANFTFVVTAPNNNVVFTNTSTLGAEPGERQAVWTFGDGNSATTGPLQGTQHTYQTAGTYTVCLKIYRRSPNGTAPVLSAQICKTVVIETTCRANFESPGTTSSPTGRYFVAIPWHNENKKPVRICWNFGDGRDTCIQYPASHTGAYAVFHQYAQPGTYNVCVNILYDGGCQATKCNTITITEPDNCRADFERIQVSPTVNPLHATFKALPWHNNDKKPVRICWTFGDGRDTCIQYSNTFAGPYTVNHLYTNPGQYEVCVNILYQGGCEARKCKPVVTGRPDSCRANFEKLPVTTASNPLTVIYKAFPWHNNNKKPARICWTFGDGRDTCINYLNIYNGQYTVPHTYSQPGQYEVCVKILYYGGCEARKCEPVRVGTTDSCGADFERVPVLSGNNPLQTYFKALPSHNNNKKPSRICWTFGDGRDTCINYTENYTGLYGVSHTYNQPGRYEVCVKIQYFGGCEARKCKLVEIIRPDICQADFEKIPVLTTNNPLHQYFKALPSHNNNRKPAKICWTFGDGRDTCINYTETYTGQYGVSHTYNQPGAYEVCVKIQYFGGCEARKCRLIEIPLPDSCRADFERLQATAGTSPLTVGFKALPWHNNDKKPVRICWQFGDGRDTCITYPPNYTGPYGVLHTYTQPGQYEVCVKILYAGGCEARKCRLITVPPPQPSCSVNLFEIAPSITSLVRGFLAVPHTEPVRRPQRICWIFGDGEDTCIMIDPQQPLPDLTIRHQYPAPGVYRACVKILFEGGCIAESCREVVIRAASNLCGGYMTDSLTGPRTYKFKGFSIHNPGDEVLSYRWTFGDGSSATGREVSHTYNQGGSYQVCLTIITRSGCETRICKTVRVPGSNAAVLHLTPNPVVTVMHVAFLSTHTEPVNIRILNGFGTVVRNYTRTVTTGPNNWDVDLALLMPGIYTFIIQSPNQLASALFIKQ